MTFKQIREIKSKYEGLTLKTNVTSMFNNKDWASVWEIKFMNEQNIKNLIKHLDDNKLCYFFGTVGIHIQ